MKRLIVGLAVVVLIGVVPTEASLVLTFDDITSLNEYASQGVTFSPNASIWHLDWPTVLDTPDGGAYDGMNALQFGDAGGESGEILFDYNVDTFGIWALSGPGPDLLNHPMYIKAFNSSDVLIGEDYADSSIQFDFLTVSGAGIRKIETYSPLVGNDVWDHMILMGSDVIPEPSTFIIWSLLGALTLTIGWWRRRRAG